MTGWRSRTGTRSAAVALAVLALGLAGCGGGDGDTTVVTDDGTVTVEQDEDEGTVKIESSEGSMTITGESGGELPEGWPAEVPVPDGGTVSASMALTGEAEQGWNASLTYPDLSTTELTDEIKAAMEGADFDRQAEVTTPDGAMLTFTGNGYAVTAMVGKEDSGAATVLMTVAKDQ